jgi:hypothetical protein
MDIPESARPTPKMIRLYHLFSHRYGEEPEDLWVYDPAEKDDPPPSLTLTNVMVWPADGDCDVTGFQTLGMSEMRMPGAGYFAELHMAIRAPLEKAGRERVARYLSNVAAYPFANGLTLDWWELIPNAGRLPGFEGCKHLLLHPRLVEGGLDEVDDEDGPVRILYVVPITPFERHLLAVHGKDSFLDYVEEEGVDLLSDRFDPPGSLDDDRGNP